MPNINARNLITARLDAIADELEAVDPRLAMALDRVSDCLDKIGASPNVTLTLPQAQRIFGQEVPWKLDEKDLAVINNILIKNPRTLTGLTAEIKEALVSNKK